MVTRADKGKSPVILPMKHYDSKITDFILANKFQTTTRDPTISFQSQVQKVTNGSKTLIPPNTKWKYVNMNPTAPTIKGLIKLHKTPHLTRGQLAWCHDIQTSETVYPKNQTTGHTPQHIQPSKHHRLNHETQGYPPTPPFCPCHSRHHQPLDLCFCHRNSQDNSQSPQE
jgi:hypothetical protein